MVDFTPQTISIPSLFLPPAQSLILKPLFFRRQKEEEEEEEEERMPVDGDGGNITNNRCMSPSRPQPQHPLTLTRISVSLVIMGVSGAGKSTIGQMLSKVVDSEFLDADDFHPPSNKEKMHHGIPLSDEDRVPWLQLLRHGLLERLRVGRSVILACSALQQDYREILRSADPDYRLGSFSCRVKFVLLDVEPKVLAARLESRAAEGKHFMPPSLLQSQLDLLRIHDTEGVFKVNAALSPQAIVSEIEDWLGSAFSCDGGPSMSVTVPNM